MLLLKLHPVPGHQSYDEPTGITNWSKGEEEEEEKHCCCSTAHCSEAEA